MEGTAYTFVSQKEQNKFAAIERLLGKQVNKASLPLELGPGPEYSPRTGRRPQRLGKKLDKTINN